MSYLLRGVHWYCSVIPRPVLLAYIALYIWYYIYTVLSWASVHSHINTHSDVLQAPQHLASKVHTRPGAS